MSTRFEPSAPLPNAINKAEVLSKSIRVEVANDLKFDRSSPSNRYERRRNRFRWECGMTRQNGFASFYFGAILSSLTAFLCGPVFSRSLISCTSNSSIHFGFSLHVDWQNQCFVCMVAPIVSCQHKINDVFCVSFRFRVTTRDIGVRTHYAYVVSLWGACASYDDLSNECKSRNDSFGNIGSGETQWDRKCVAMETCLAKKLHRWVCLKAKFESKEWIHGVRADCELPNYW